MYSVYNYIVLFTFRNRLNLFSTSARVRVTVRVRSVAALGDIGLCFYTLIKHVKFREILKFSILILFISSGLVDLVLWFG